MSNDNIHFEPNLISQYQKEYLTLINYYTQLTRNSVFVKYFNINLSSTYDDKLFSTYDRYNASDIKFNIYEYTPIYHIQAISNRSTYSEDKAGDVLEGVSSITVNTISRPRINDLIYFYSPIHSQEIFRVINFSTVSNMLHSDPPVNWYELDIEYAPIEDINNLTIFNHYIYDLSIEEYLTLEDYRTKLDNFNLISNILFSAKTFYNKNLDIYLTDDRYIPIDLNVMIFNLKTSSDLKSKYKKTLEQYPTPYGYTKYIDSVIAPYSTTLLEFNNKFLVYDLEEKLIIEYEFEDMKTPINDLENLILYGYQLMSF